ncbi:monooxygenase [Ascodesmis nigricans]|uniref:L-ornithine N(5)-monooxygenase [NAD(P)H] n=1 Tax=Ascodesmis nigricans TaxID=341454 RepID=A0A4S2MIA9_9PEZI|nr:monooxygenase [Ascodesmis nigricans]
MKVPQQSASRYTEILAIGAGLSGIALLSRLQLEYDFTDIHIYERHADSGGTWWVNSYPGAACDVPSALYSYSFAQNPRWTCMMPSAREIKAYQDSVAARFNAGEKMTFRAEAIRAEWLEEKRRWRVSLRNVDTGECWVHECRILFSCTGALVTPNIPEIPGMEEWQGEVVHSARWHPAVQVKGKRVAVIGNGCTAAQIVPAIIDDDAALVTQFARSKHYIQRAPYFPINAVTVWVLTHIPLAMRALRFLVFVVAECGIRFQSMGVVGRVSRWLKRREVVAYMRKMAPERYHADLIPEFEIGCKRRIMDPGYLISLHSPNVDLINTANNPIHLDPATASIRTASGNSYPTDLIILATGFKTPDFLPGLEVLGRGGISIRDHWNNNLGGPGSYNCAVNHGFPNFFVVLGPNHATGHTSAVMAIENVVDYALKVIEPVLRGSVDVVEVKKEAEEAYVRRLQKALGNTVWATGCGSWYTTKSGWNAMSYPWSQAHFWYRCAFVRKRDWVFSPAKQPRTKVWRRKRSGATVPMVVGLVAAALAGAAVVGARQEGITVEELKGITVEGLKNVGEAVLRWVHERL